MLTSVIAAMLVLVSANSALVFAAPHKQGHVPPTVGLYEAKPDGCSALGTIVGIVGGVGGKKILGEILSEVSGEAMDYYTAKGCSETIAEAYSRVAWAFENAYLRAEVWPASPGYPDGYIHDWADVKIQDFEGGTDGSGNRRGDGDGAILWSGSSTDPSKVAKPYYVGGGFWVAYKHAVNEPNVVGTPLYPGYPINDEHVWPGSTIRIQDFRGGSWGDAAIIGTDEKAWLVAGRHWEAYWQHEGQLKLRNPLGPLYIDSDGWYTQDFEGGRIRELAGEIKVEFNDDSSAIEPAGDVPAEMPPVGRQEPTAPPSSTSCSDTGVPQATSPLTYSPQNPDTTTEVTFIVTITNVGCGTFAPSVLAIGGRDPSGNVTDPYQSTDFELAPGESRTLSQSVVLDALGTHEFFMAHRSGGWHRIADTSGDSTSIYVTVTDAAEVEANVTSDGGEAPPAPTEAPPAPTQVPPTDTTAVDGDTAPMDIGASGPNGHEIGAQFMVTTEDGTILGSCILEGDAAAPYRLSCRVPVPRYTTVVVTLDVDTITPGYVPVENPIFFDTSSDPGAASHWGVSFQLEPQGSTAIDGQPPDVAIDSASDAEAVNIALITRDPQDGHLLTGTCYVLVNASNEGCDENGDGQVTFDAIPFGTYTVHQTQAPAGYPSINDYEIAVEPTGYMEGPSFGVPLGFIVKQAPEQNAPDTRNVSVVFLDMLTHERVTTGACVELIGASNVGCDEDLIDGQVDFLDVPAGGPYELSFSNLPAGYEAATVGGPLAVTIDAGPSDPANVMVFALLAGPDGAGGATIQPADSSSSSGAQDPASTSGVTEATVLMTFRGCPEGFVPDVDDPYTACTIPLDAPDASLVGELGVGQSLVPITGLERQYDGSYVFHANSDHGYYLELTGLEPVLRDDFLIYGVDDQDGSSYITLLDNGETGEIFVFYYYQ